MCEVLVYYEGNKWRAEKPVEAVLLHPEKETYFLCRWMDWGLREKIVFEMVDSHVTKNKNEHAS